MRTVSLKITDLVNLVGNLKRFSQRTHQLVVRVDNVYRHQLMPGVIIEIAADDLVVDAPLVERVSGAVDAYETMPGANELHQGTLLLVGHGQFSGGIEHDRAISLQILFRECAHIFRHRRVKGAGFLSNFLHNLRG